jgi:acylphosphatase
MRWWVRARALERGLVGSATNLTDGRVEVVAQGPRSALEDFVAVLESGAGPGRVEGVVVRWSPARSGVAGFVER